MNDLLLIMSSIMPEEMILDELQKSLDEYKSSGEGKDKVTMFCALLLSKELTGKNGAVETIKEFETTRKAMDFFNPTKQ